MADGSVIIDTRIDTGGISKGMNGIGGGLKKLGSLVATAFAVDKLVEFGKQAIELGSDLQEVQNVVDVTFTTLNEQVNEFAKNAAASAGLSETMAKRYVGTFGAMADSFGFTEEAAYEMSTTLTQLSGDVASFYNITQDEAMNKLKGVFTGETEGLKELAVVMTQTALDAYAMEKGIGKTVSQMTEQEKVALRYQFVLDRLSAASGDFVRTQDSWANQSRILSLQWESLMATIGTGLINVLTPAMQHINSDVMPMLSQMAQDFADSSQTIGEKFQNFIAPMQDVDFGPLGESAANLGASFGELAGVIGDGLSWAYQNVLVPFGQWSIEAGIPAIVDALAAAFSALSAALEWVAPALEAFWNNLEPVFSFLADVAVVAIEKLTAAFSFLADMISTTNVDPVKALGDAWNANAQYMLTGTVPMITEGYEQIEQAAIESATTAEQAYTNSFQTAETNVAASTDAMAADAQAFGTELAAATDSVEAGATQMSDASTAATESAFASIEGSGQETAAATAQAFDESANTIEAAWAEMGPSFDASVVAPINVGFESIASTAAATWSAVASNTSSAWAGIVSTVQNAVNQIQSSINSITGKTVYVNVQATGSGLSYMSSSANTASVASVAMPMLAKGAVIPPNAPFAAILGDQKNGTNIEAPLDTIKQAVAEVIGEDDRQIVVQVNINYSGDLAQLGRALKPVIDAEAQRVGKNLAKAVVWE